MHTSDVVDLQVRTTSKSTLLERLFRVNQKEKGRLEIVAPCVFGKLTKINLTFILDISASYACACSKSKKQGVNL